MFSCTDWLEKIFGEKPPKISLMNTKAGYMRCLVLATTSSRNKRDSVVINMLYGLTSCRVGTHSCLHVHQIDFDHLVVLPKRTRERKRQGTCSRSASSVRRTPSWPDLSKRQMRMLPVLNVGTISTAGPLLLHTDGL